MICTLRNHHDCFSPALSSSRGRSLALTHDAHDHHADGALLTHSLSFTRRHKSILQGKSAASGSEGNARVNEENATVLLDCGDYCTCGRCQCS